MTEKAWRVIPTYKMEIDGEAVYKSVVLSTAGECYRFENRAQINGRWAKDVGDRATHRVFIGLDGTNYRYKFFPRECRHGTGNDEYIVQQLLIALRNGPGECEGDPAEEIPVTITKTPWMRRPANQSPFPAIDGRQPRWQMPVPGDEVVLWLMAAATEEREVYVTVSKFYPDGKLAGIVSRERVLARAWRGSYARGSSADFEEPHIIRYV